MCKNYFTQFVTVCSETYILIYSVLSTFCDGKEFTGHSRKCGVPKGATKDLHVMWLRICELRTNCQNLINGVTAVISGGECDRCSFW